MNTGCVIVDANIAFKMLSAGQRELRDRLSPASPLRFQSPRFLFVELFKHKERLERATRLTEDELLEALHARVKRIEFIDETTIPLGTWMEAHRLCREVDETDTPYVALTSHSGGRLRMADEALKTGLPAQGSDRFHQP